jgi:hypothetical protein
MIDDQLGTRDRIQVVLAEYTSLRAEITQRGSWQIQMSTVGGTVTVAIFGYMFAYQAVYAGVFLLFFTAILLIVGLAYNEREVRTIVIHLRLLEERINKLAREELLTWELRSGILSVGYGERLRRFFAGTSN